MSQVSPANNGRNESAVSVTSHSLENETVRRVMWRLMPLLVLGYFCNYLDRVNVGFGALTMNKALGFSSATFGFGSGLFFVGYLLFDLPSNLLMAKLGARWWIARILFSWGLISALTAFVWNAWSFFGIRFLLGVAEAGFYPGMVLYMTWWFPARYRSRAQAFLQSGVALSVIVGPPVSGWLLTTHGVLGLEGWQLLFVVEALPAILTSFVFLAFLTDRPATATWLRADQRNWLEHELAAEESQRDAVHRFSLIEALINPRVWLLTIAYFGQSAANFTLVVFLPQIVRSMGVSIQMTGFLTAVPFLFGTAAMFYLSRRSDRSGKRITYVVLSCLLSAAGMIACSLIGPTYPVLMMAALIFGMMGQMSIAATFWVLPTTMLSGMAAAGGIALINSVGNLGGFVAPYIYGLIKDATQGSNTLALMVLAGAPILSTLALLALGLHPQQRRQASS